ncbi:MAG: hypothetical protein U0835_18590 [Isosphaeraceae bacterium]
MTMALCFRCGRTKFGAICPCPTCGLASTGDMNLDIAFSDHHLTVETLKGFGEVVRAIRRVCDDDELGFWSFIRYVSANHSHLLGVKMTPENQARCDDVLARASPPPVVVEESRAARLRREREGSGGADD